MGRKPLTEAVTGLDVKVDYRFTNEQESRLFTLEKLIYSCQSQIADKQQSLI